MDHCGARAHFGTSRRGHGMGRVAGQARGMGWGDEMRTRPSFSGPWRGPGRRVVLRGGESPACSVLQTESRVSPGG